MQVFKIFLILFVLTATLYPPIIGETRPTTEEITLEDGSKMTIRRNRKGRIMGQDRAKLKELGLLEQYEANFRPAEQKKPPNTALLLEKLREMREKKQKDRKNENHPALELESGDHGWGGKKSGITLIYVDESQEERSSKKQTKVPSPKKPEIKNPQKPKDSRLLKVRYKKRNLRVHYAKK